MDQTNRYDFETDTIYYKDIVVKGFFKSFAQQDYQKDYVRNNLMMLCVGGSHSYGLNTPTSDIDIRGIFKDSIDQILGFDKIEQLQANNNDVTIFSFTKAIELITNQNPNMMELLWVDRDEILFATDDYWYLRSRRFELLSKLAKHKYSGYAMAQLKRIRGHNKWLNKELEGRFNNPPHIENYITFIEDGRVHTDFKFSKNHYFVKVKSRIYNVYKNYDFRKSYSLIGEGNNFIPEQEKQVNSDDDFLGVIFVNKKAFNEDVKEYSGWTTWKANRNVVRHTLEEEYGYDTKHAMHTFRLLQMGIEILEQGEVKVKRPNREFLLDIRKGKYSYEWILEKAELLDKTVIQKAYENSSLRNSVDRKVVLEIIKKVLGV